MGGAIVDKMLEGLLEGAAEVKARLKEIEEPRKLKTSKLVAELAAFSAGALETKRTLDELRQVDTVAAALSITDADRAEDETLRQVIDELQALFDQSATLILAVAAEIDRRIPIPD